MVSSLSSLMVGTKLSDVEKAARKNVEQLQMYKQELFLPRQLLLLEIVLVLSGKVNDPVVVNGSQSTSSAGKDAKQTPPKIVDRIIWATFEHHWKWATSVEL
jgi:hypothetical protein